LAGQTDRLTEENDQQTQSTKRTGRDSNPEYLETKQDNWTIYCGSTEPSVLEIDQVVWAVSLAGGRGGDEIKRRFTKFSLRNWPV